MIYDAYLDAVGDTPLVKIELENVSGINIYSKLEFFNPTGSVKDRAAQYIINTLLENKVINKETTIIESSSGNFGIALASYCKAKDLKFYCVVDSHILKTNEMLINKLSSQMFKVIDVDENGGYLLNRIRKVNELKGEIENSYWINQYGNKYNSDAYYYTLGEEICNDLDRIDYVFMGVSSGGTITGVSQRIKHSYPNAKIIAVDTTGSVIFGGNPQKRYIPGIGSSMVPDILQYSKIDEVITVDEVDAIDMCHNLMEKYSIFTGGSSGSVCVAIRKYFENKRFNYIPNVVTIFPDRGDRYVNTIYDEDWCKRIFDYERGVKSECCI